MMKTVFIRYGYLLGICIEVLLFLFFFYTQEEINETFRYAARYSGRLSLIVYLLSFSLFAKAYLKNESFEDTQKALGVFAVLHLIHFVYLSGSIYLNAVPIVPVRLAGGFLAYLMIVLYPFFIKKIQRNIFHFIYFYYVGFVMIMTYIARVKGEFVGAKPEAFHYIGLVCLVLFLLFFGVRFITSKEK